MHDPDDHSVNVGLRPMFKDIDGNHHPSGPASTANPTTTKKAAGIASGHIQTRCLKLHVIPASS
ncbi:MAG: hypothetical protein ACKPHU_05410, partial [Planctomycetaceae bacterium]